MSCHTEAAGASVRSELHHTRQRQSCRPESAGAPLRSQLPSTSQPMSCRRKEAVAHPAPKRAARARSALARRLFPKPPPHSHRVAAPGVLALRSLAPNPNVHPPNQHRSRLVPCRPRVAPPRPRFSRRASVARFPPMPPSPWLISFRRPDAKNGGGARLCSGALRGSDNSKFRCTRGEPVIGSRMRATELSLSDHAARTSAQPEEPQQESAPLSPLRVRLLLRLFGQRSPPSTASMPRFSHSEDARIPARTHALGA